MSPEGKTRKPVRRKAAAFGDHSSGDGYLDGPFVGTVTEAPMLEIAPWPGT